MIKGHTKIELTDVNTGEVEVIEEDNFMTNYPDYLAMEKDNLCTIYTNPYLMVSLFNYDIHSVNSAYANAVFGGIMLFDTALGDDPNLIIPPDGVTMTANSAYEYVTVTEIPELGVYNEKESSQSYSIANNTFTQSFVYDFTTDKGNGKIASVCLCDRLAGLMGYGNTSKQYANDLTTADNVSMTNRNLKLYNSNSSKYTIYSNTQTTAGYYYPVFADGDNNVLYTYNENILSASDIGIMSGKLNLVRYYLPFKSRNAVGVSSITNNVSYNTLTTIGIGEDRLLSLPIPDVFKAYINNANQYRGLNFYTDDTGVWIMACATYNGLLTHTNNCVAQAGSRILLWHIDLDFKYEVYQFTIPTGIDILAILSSNGNGSVFSVYDGYLYVCAPQGTFYYRNASGSYTTKSFGDATTSGVYRVPLNSPTAFEKVGTDIADMKARNGTPSNWYCTFVKYSNRLWLGMIGGYNANTYNTMHYIVDSVNNVILTVNGGNYSANSMVTNTYNTDYSAIRWVAIKGINDVYLRYTTYSSNSQLYTMLNIMPKYNRGLSTINNLSEPVYKTADKTMKITYTITGTLFPDRQAEVLPDYSEFVTE